MCEKCESFAHPYLLRKAIKGKQLRLNADAEEKVKTIENHAIAFDQCVFRRGHHLDKEWMHIRMDVRQKHKEHWSQIELVRDMTFSFLNYLSNVIDCNLEWEGNLLCEYCLDDIRRAEQLDAEWFTKIFTPFGEMKKPFRASEEEEEEKEYKTDDKTDDKKTTTQSLLDRTKRLSRHYQQPQEDHPTPNNPQTSTISSFPVYQTPSDPNLVDRALTRLTRIHSPRTTRSYQRLQ